MRVLHAASSYPLGPGDTTAPFMEEMLGALANRGHRVSVVVPRVKGLLEGARNGVEVQGAGYAPQRFQQWGYGRSLTSDGSLRAVAALVTPFALTSMGRVLRSNIKTEKPDVVHLHWVLPQGLLAVVVPRSLPLVVSIHGADVAFSRGLLRNIARGVLARADAVVAASTGVLSAVADIHPGIESKSHVIPHGANDLLLRGRSSSQARRRLGLVPEEAIILAVGRLVPKKGFETLIRSMVHLGPAGPRLFIIGEGLDRARLEAAIPTEMTDRIHLIGSRSRGDLADWYAASDVVVVPSVPTGGDVDSGPVVLMEAMAAGRAVVATRIGMAPDLIETGVNGVLLDSIGEDEVAKAIDVALRSAEPFGRAARETFERVGGWTRVAEDLETVYRKVMIEPPVKR
ncbi:MAG: glycosyltransferase family 4 protein [Acidimicrobiia bacterium]